jgi:chromosome segregation ATPase
MSESADPLSSLARENAALSTEILSLKAEISTLREDLLEAQLRAEAFRDSNKSLSAQIDSLSTDKAILEGELNFYKNREPPSVPPPNDNLSHQIAVLQAQLAVSQQQIDLREDDFQQLRDSIEAQHCEEIQARDAVIEKLRRKLQSGEAKSSSGSYVEREEILRMKRELGGLEDNVRKGQKKYSVLKRKYVAAGEKVRQLSEEVDELRTGRESLNRQIEDEAGRMRIERQGFESRIRQVQESLANEKDRGDGLREKLRKAEDELAQLRCVLKILADNDRKLRKLGLENENVLEEIRNLNGKIDRAGLAAAPTKRRATSPKREITQGRPNWRAFRDL